MTFEKLPITVIELDFSSEFITLNNNLATTVSFTDVIDYST